MEKRKKLLLAGVLLLVFAAVKIGALVWWRERQPAAKAAACDVRRGCTLPNGVYVKFGGAGAAKQPFDVELKNVPAAVGETGISFSMKGMDMGFNRFEFAQRGGGVWTAEQIRLPFCVENRRDYLADIYIGGEVFQVEFSAY